MKDNALLYAYKSGKPESLYCDPDLTTVHPTPLVADCKGIFPDFYYAPSLKRIKIVIHDRLGNVIFRDGEEGECSD